VCGGGFTACDEMMSGDHGENGVRVGYVES
jgi:hypothetical protein